MHYSTRSCAKGSEDVITKPDGSKLTLTKGHSLSQHDINQINMVYKCDMAPTPSPPPTTPGPGTTRPPVTTGPATTAPPNKQCCSKYEIKRLSGRVNLMDNGIYEYKVIILLEKLLLSFFQGMFNDKPWYQNTKSWAGGTRYQKLYFKANCQGPHWGTYHELSMDRMNTRTKGTNNPACPEDGIEWSLPTSVKVNAKYSYTKTSRKHETFSVLTINRHKQQSLQQRSRLLPNQRPLNHQQPPNKPLANHQHQRHVNWEASKALVNQLAISVIWRRLRYLMETTTDLRPRSSVANITVWTWSIQKIPSSTRKNQPLPTVRVPTATVNGSSTRVMFSVLSVQLLNFKLVMARSRSSLNGILVSPSTSLSPLMLGKPEFLFIILRKYFSATDGWHAALDFNNNIVGHGPELVEIVQGTFFTKV